MKLKQTVIGGMLLVAALGSQALSIGRVRGAAWIGQALDVSIPVRLDASEDAASLCFDADVFHADTKIDSRNVRIVVDAGQVAQGDAKEVNVRVRSATVVDEPVVTVYLKVGCDQKVTRRLVLLAELPTETSSAVTAAPLPVAPVPSLIAPAPTPATPTAPAPRPAPVRRAGSGDDASSANPTPRPARAPRPAVAAPAAPTAPVEAAPRPQPKAAAPAPVAPPVAAKAPAPAPAPAPTSRLKLDAVDILPPPTDGALKTTNVLATAPVEDPKKRAEAAALWSSINAQPDDVMRDTQRLQSLEASINALRTQMSQNQQQITTLRSQLDEAQNERYANPLVYVLSALLLVALGIAGFFWQRSRRTVQSRKGDWWRDVDLRNPNTVMVPPLNEEEGLALVEGRPPGPKPAPASTSDKTVAVPRAAPAAAPTRELDLDLGFDDSGLARPAVASQPAYQAHLPRRMHTDFHSSFGGSSRSVNTEELFDIHQQADFFLSLGQHEQAIGVLLGHIRDNPETSALAYLDLFRIYHQQGRREPFDLLRDEFHRAFNAEVPEFDSYNEKGRGLEAYAETLQRVVQLWRTPDAVTLIEELIFRHPDDNGGKTFDLEAYKELLLLFAIALEVAEGDDEADFVVSGPAAFPVLGVAPTVPPTIDDEIHSHREATVSLPPLTLEEDSRPPPGTPIDLVLSDSMVAPLESLPKPRAPGDKRSDPPNSGIDFDLFDPSTEADIKPKK